MRADQRLIAREVIRRGGRHRRGGVQRRQAALQHGQLVELAPPRRARRVVWRSELLVLVEPRRGFGRRRARLIEDGQAFAQQFEARRFARQARGPAFVLGLVERAGAAQLADRGAQQALLLGGQARLAFELCQQRAASGEAAALRCQRVAPAQVRGVIQAGDGGVGDEVGAERIEFARRRRPLAVEAR
mgnify:CR=1 FL=1